MEPSPTLGTTDITVAVFSELVNITKNKTEHFWINQQAPFKVKETYETQDIDYLSNKIMFQLTQDRIQSAIMLPKQ